MMNRDSAGPLVAEVGYVAISVRDLDAARRFATTTLGLRESETGPDRAAFTPGGPRYSIVYLQGDGDAVHHVAFRLAGPDRLDQLRSRLAQRGTRVIADRPFDDDLGSGLVFEGPESFLCEVYTAMPQDGPDYVPSGVRPTRLGHFNFHARDPEAMSRFFIDVLGFRTSDVFDDGTRFFLRCNVDHHGIAVTPGPGVLHHHGWEVQGIADLGRLADALDAQGRHVLWGPVRHGVGRNIAVYFQEPAGTVIEFYTDMERIYDDDRPPGVWSPSDPRYYSFWARMRPEGFRDLGLSPLTPAATAAAQTAGRRNG